MSQGFLLEVFLATKLLTGKYVRTEHVCCRAIHGIVYFVLYIFATGLFTVLSFCTVHVCHKAIHWTGLLYSTYLPQSHSLDWTFVQCMFATRPFTGLDFCTLHVCHKAIY